jgi:hypothetical protein
VARRRTSAAEVVAPDVRGALAGRFRRLAVRYAGLGVGGRVPPGGGRFAVLVAALEDGEPVTVYAWQLPRSVGVRRGPGRVRVEPDGTLSPALRRTS